VPERGNTFAVGDDDAAGRGVTPRGWRAVGGSGVEGEGGGAVQVESITEAGPYRCVYIIRDVCVYVHDVCRPPASGVPARIRRRRRRRHYDTTPRNRTYARVYALPSKTRIRTGIKRL